MYYASEIGGAATAESGLYLVPFGGAPGGVLAGELGGLAQQGSRDLFFWHRSGASDYLKSILQGAIPGGDALDFFPVAPAGEGSNRRAPACVK